MMNRSASRAFAGDKTSSSARSGSTMQRPKYGANKTGRAVKGMTHVRIPLTKAVAAALRGAQNFGKGSTTKNAPGVAVNTRKVMDADVTSDVQTKAPAVKRPVMKNPTKSGNLQSSMNKATSAAQNTKSGTKYNPGIAMNAKKADRSGRTTKKNGGTVGASKCKGC